MRSKIDLPDPWVEVAQIPPEEADRLEALVGSRLTYDDLSESDVIREGQLIQPNSQRALYVQARKWFRLHNVDTDAEVIVRMQSAGAPTFVQDVTAVIVPFVAGRTLTGTDLRNVPVQAIGTAYTKWEQEGHFKMRIGLALNGQERPDPLAPLPPASGKPDFAALVALQFLEVEKKHPKENPAKVMQRLNKRDGEETPLSTVQRWITRARKYGFLPPAGGR